MRQSLNYRPFQTADFGVEIKDNSGESHRRIYGVTVWEAASAITSILLLFAIVNVATNLFLLFALTISVFSVGICCLWGKSLNTVLHFTVALGFLFSIAVLCCFDIAAGRSGNFIGGPTCATSNKPNRILQDHVELPTSVLRDIQNLNSAKLFDPNIASKCQTKNLAPLIFGQTVMYGVSALLLLILLFHGWRGTQMPYLKHHKIEAKWSKLEFESRSRVSFWQCYVAILGISFIFSVISLVLLDFLIGVPLLLLLVVASLGWIFLKPNTEVSFYRRDDYKEKEFFNVDRSTSFSFIMNPTKLTCGENHALKTRVLRRRILSSVLVVTSLAALSCASIRVSHLGPNLELLSDFGLGAQSPLLKKYYQEFAEITSDNNDMKKTQGKNTFLSKYIGFKLARESSVDIKTHVPASMELTTVAGLIDFAVLITAIIITLFSFLIWFGTVMKCNFAKKILKDLITVHPTERDYTDSDHKPKKTITPKSKLSPISKIERSPFSSNHMQENRPQTFRKKKVTTLNFNHAVDNVKKEKPNANDAVNSDSDRTFSTPKCYNEMDSELGCPNDLDSLNINQYYKNETDMSDDVKIEDFPKKNDFYTPSLSKTQDKLESDQPDTFIMENELDRELAAIERRIQESDVHQILQPITRESILIGSSSLVRRNSLSGALSRHIEGYFQKDASLLLSRDYSFECHPGILTRRSLYSPGSPAYETEPSSFNSKMSKIDHKIVLTNPMIPNLPNSSETYNQLVQSVELLNHGKMSGHYTGFILANRPRLRRNVSNQSIIDLSSMPLLSGTSTVRSAHNIWEPYSCAKTDSMLSQDELNHPEKKFSPLSSSEHSPVDIVASGCVSPTISSAESSSHEPDTAEISQSELPQFNNSIMRVEYRMEDTCDSDGKSSSTSRATLVKVDKTCDYERYSMSDLENLESTKNDVSSPDSKKFGFISSSMNEVLDKSLDKSLDKTSDVAGDPKTSTHVKCSFLVKDNSIVSTTANLSQEIKEQLEAESRQDSVEQSEETSPKIYEDSISINKSSERKDMRTKAENDTKETIGFSWHNKSSHGIPSPSSGKCYSTSTLLPELRFPNPSSDSADTRVPRKNMSNACGVSTASSITEIVNSTQEPVSYNI